ncbi:MAG: SulP family inorganic anion transporter [Pseudomonadales bacterium]|nr:SulP family inorganic anion transporter [Pseudomonadales bacterium]
MTSSGSIRGDVFGGLTAAVVALPLALAFGVASGAGALAGLYGAILVGFFAAVWGGTAVQISGPTGPMTVVMAAIVTQFSGSLSEVFLVVVLTGVLQIIYGVAGFGRYIKLVPQPVVSGFMSGIGFIVILLQLAPMLGQQTPEGSNLVLLAALPEMLASPGMAALILGFLSFGIVVLTPERITRYVPSTLLAIIVGTLVGIFLFPEAPVIGAIPSGLPALQLPSASLADLPLILRFALILSFLGAIDSLLTSLVADSMTRTSHDSNRELIGQGIGNMVAGLLGGIAGAGATMRTLVNIRAGGSTRLSGAIHALALLLMVLIFADVASHIPLAVLAGILMKVGIDIIDWRSLKNAGRASRSGVVIMLTTLLITVFVDLMAAVAVGIVMASVLFVARMAEAQLASVRFHFGVSPELNLSPEEEVILNEAAGKIVLFHVEGPLSFGSARDIAKLMGSSRREEVLIVDLSLVPFIDSSAAAALEEVLDRFRRSGDTMIIFGASQKVRHTLNRTEVLQHLGEQGLASSRLEALRAARAVLRARQPA